jgi:hypothetical protein
MLQSSKISVGPFFRALLLTVGLFMLPAAAALAEPDSMEGANSNAAPAQSCEAAEEVQQGERERYRGFDFLAAREKAGLQTPAVVLAINYYRQNIFPDEGYWLAGIANRFNIITRESTLRAAMPFVIGDRVVDEQLEEAERILRRQRYLYDARVKIEARCAEGIVVAVIVRDVWTLVPNFGFARAGGDNRTEFGITESNILGTGKAISLSYRSDLDRSGIQFAYSDPNIAGSRWTGAASVSNNDDGDVLAARVERPFYALDATWATGATVSSASREQPLEFLSESLFEIDVEQQAGEVYFGRSRGRVGRWVDRFSAGYALSDERYDFPLDFPGEQRLERRFSYPFLSWERIEDRFVTGANLQRVERTEDLSLGLRATARIGWSTPELGGDEEVLLYAAAASKRWYVTQNQLLGFDAALSGRYATDSGEGTQDLIASTAVDYLWRHNPRFSLYARARFTATRDLDPESQLTLGGDSGMRGYPSRYQTGDRSYIATLEERYYSDWFPFGLFRVGFAAFVDVGRAWFEDQPPSWIPDQKGEHFGTLANVGIGLRLESVRTRRDRVFHIDLAHPLVDGPGVDSVQLTLSAKRSL